MTGSFYAPVIGGPVSAPAQASSQGGISKLVPFYSQGSSSGGVMPPFAIPAQTQTITPPAPPSWPSQMPTSLADFLSSKGLKPSDLYSSSFKPWDVGTGFPSKDVKNSFYDFFGDQPNKSKAPILGVNYMDAKDPTFPRPKVGTWQNGLQDDPAARLQSARDWLASLQAGNQYIKPTTIG